MYRKYVSECGYQNRREYRSALEEWLVTTDTNLFVTLSLGQDARLSQARQLLSVRRIGCGRHGSSDAR